MRSNEAREQMVARVQAAHKKWPSFDKLPEKSGDYTAPLDQALLAVNPGEAYVKALYSACVRGEPVGRVGLAIAAKVVKDKAI